MTFIIQSLKNAVLIWIGHSENVTKLFKNMHSLIDHINNAGGLWGGGWNYSRQ